MLSGFEYQCSEFPTPKVRLDTLRVLLFCAPAHKDFPFVPFFDSVDNVTGPFTDDETCSEDHSYPFII